jgi:glucose-1-phosphate cytidylyltransferase
MKVKMDPSSIPVLILAGGFGTRLSEETHLIPKPMVEIGGTPILVHLMRWYYKFGFNDFVICAGYKSSAIKQYFSNYSIQQNHLEINSLGSEPRILPLGRERSREEKWRVRIIDSGEDAMTGARVARVLDFLESVDGAIPNTFALTYGDGLTDCDLKKELNFHTQHGLLGTVLGVHPVARFGELTTDSNSNVLEFMEKPQSHHDIINGGFFFFNKKFRPYINTNSDCILEKVPLMTLAKDKQLKMYRHDGFWHPMDSLRDKHHLQKLWETDMAPWKTPIGDYIK